MILIGLDPGVDTGYARADARTQQLTDVRTLKIHAAMKLVEMAAPALVIFEDARTRKWFRQRDGNQDKYGAGVREGVGSVKRDSKIWMDFLDDLGIPYMAKPPGGTKVGKLYFKAATGWAGRTSNHARDAGMMVIGINVGMAERLIRDFKQQNEPPVKATAVPASAW